MNPLDALQEIPYKVRVYFYLTLIIGNTVLIPLNAAGMVDNVWVSITNGLSAVFGLTAIANVTRKASTEPEDQGFTEGTF